MLEDNLGGAGDLGEFLYLKILEVSFMSFEKKQLINSIFRCSAFLKDIFSYKR